jgi:hypothetical protein
LWQEKLVFCLDILKMKIQNLLLFYELLYNKHILRALYKNTSTSHILKRKRTGYQNFYDTKVNDIFQNNIILQNKESMVFTQLMKKYHASRDRVKLMPNSVALDPSLEQFPQLTRIFAPPPEPTALQALLSPSHAWDDQNPPHPSGPAWLQLHVEQLEPHHAGTGTILV